MGIITRAFKGNMAMSAQPQFEARQASYRQQPQYQNNYRSMPAAGIPATTTYSDPRVDEGRQGQMPKSCSPEVRRAV